MILGAADLTALRAEVHRRRLQADPADHVFWDQLHSIVDTAQREPVLKDPLAIAEQQLGRRFS